MVVFLLIYKLQHKCQLINTHISSPKNTRLETIYINYIHVVLFYKQWSQLITAKLLRLHGLHGMSSNAISTITVVSIAITRYRMGATAGVVIVLFL